MDEELEGTDQGNGGEVQPDVGTQTATAPNEQDSQKAKAFDSAAFEAIMGGKPIPTPDQAVAGLTAKKPVTPTPTPTPTAVQGQQAATPPAPAAGQQQPGVAVDQATGQQVDVQQVYDHPMFQAVFQAAIALEKSGLTPEQIMERLSGQGGVAQAGTPQGQMQGTPQGQMQAAPNGQTANGQGANAPAAPLSAEALKQAGLLTDIPDETMMSDTERVSWGQTLRLGNIIVEQQQAMRQAQTEVARTLEQVQMMGMALAERDLQDGHRLVDELFPEFADDKAKMDSWEATAATYIKADRTLTWDKALKMAATSLLGPEEVERRAQHKVYEGMKRTKGRVTTAKGGSAPGRTPMSQADIDAQAFEQATGGR